MTRLFPARASESALPTLPPRDPPRRNLTLAGIAIDAADGAAGYLGMASGQVSRKAGFGLIVPAAGAVVAGLSGLRRRS